MKQNIIQEAIEGFLSPRQANTLSKLLNALNSLMAETVDVRRVDDIQNEVTEALAYMERDFPLSLLVRKKFSINIKNIFKRLTVI